MDSRPLAALLASAGLACTADPPPAPQPPMPREQFGQDRAPQNPVSGERAHKHLVDLCAIGPRVSGTAGMRRQQKSLRDHFEAYGAAVALQEFAATQKSAPRPVPMANLVASWHPARAERVILCAHYDTRPSAHEEPNRADWNKPFVSANDGTSGVALLMELARHLKDWPTTVGVDVVLFDGEEYILDPGVPYVREGDKYFLGSTHFADEYAKGRGPVRGAKYKAAVLLDLFAHPGARLAVEGYSLRSAPQLVDEIWRAAAKVGAKSFRYERGFRRGDDVQDDHVPLNAAGIPAVDVIDFDYEDWHKLSDTPDKCSPAQLAEVGGVLLEWLKTK